MLLPPTLPPHPLPASQRIPEPGEAFLVQNPPEISLPPPPPPPPPSLPTFASEKGVGGWEPAPSCPQHGPGRVLQPPPNPPGHWGIAAPWGFGPSGTEGEIPRGLDSQRRLFFSLFFTSLITLSHLTCQGSRSCFLRCSAFWKMLPCSHGSAGQRAQLALTLPAGRDALARGAASAVPCRSLPVRTVTPRGLFLGVGTAGVGFISPCPPGVMGLAAWGLGLRRGRPARPPAASLDGPSNCSRVLPAAAPRPLSIPP